MAIVKMKKIQIVFPSKIKEDVLDLLQEKGVSQIDFFDTETIKKYDSKQSVVEKTDYEYMLAETKFAIDFLDKYKTIEKKSFIKKLQAGKFQSITKNEYAEIIKNYPYREKIEECKSLEEKLNFHQNKKRELSEELAEIIKWKNLKINFADGLETLKTKTFIGTIKADKLVGLQNHLKQNDANFEIYETGQDGDNVQVFIVFLKDKEESVKKDLTEFGFDYTFFKDISGTVEYEILMSNTAIEFHDTQIRNLIDRAKELSSQQSILKVVYDYYNTKLAQQATSEKILNMKFVSVLQAWVIDEKLQELEKSMLDISHTINIVEVNTDGKENMPIKLKNSNLIEPFESVTLLYGVPKSTEVDPTLWLSLSFAIFFGFMLSDAGYGAIVVLGAVLAIKLLKLPREEQTLYRLMIYCGVFTIIIGALMGGWFGIDIDKLNTESPSWLSAFFIKARIINPIADPLTLMYAAFGLGFAHVLWALVAKFFQSWKNNQKVAAFLDAGLWLCFLPTLVYWAITGSQIAKYGVWVGLVALILTQGREKKSIVGKGFSGVLSLYSVVSLFSDVLSYARLVALGLATGIIAMIVNQVAGIFGGMIPYIGWVVTVLILIVGHSFNLAINVLGAHIHSSRLEYVEFFGKFFEGGGKAFIPFKRQFTYIKLVD